MTPSGRSRNMAARWIKDPRFSQGATTALAWLTTPAMDRTEPMHGPKTPSSTHEAIALSAAVGEGNSCHSSVLLKQRNHGSDSHGIAFGGVELVAALDKIATAPHKPKWLRACYLPEARRMDRNQTSELFCNRRTNMRRWWSWPPKNTASTWISRCSERGRNQYTARSRAR